MKENGDHRGIAMNPVFFDAGHAVIAGLKQVLAHIFSIFWLKWCERNTLLLLWYACSRRTKLCLDLCRFSCVLGLIKTTHTKTICSLCESSIYFFSPAVGGRHCCIKWWQSIFIFGIKGYIWKGTEPCTVAAIILDLLQRRHLWSSWWFVWCQYGLSDKSSKTVCTLSFYFYRVTIHSRITCNIGST